MQITSALAGFTLGQADIMRRAMGKKKASVLESMRQDFVEGAKREHNIPEQLSEQIFSLLQHFAAYGFNKSHSVAYALRRSVHSVRPRKTCACARLVLACQKPSRKES